MSAPEIRRENPAKSLALKRIVQAIKAGIPALTLKDELMTLETTKTELETRLATAPEPIPRLHPNLAE